MNFNNLNDLFKYIENQLQDTMKNDVSEMAKDRMSQSVNKSVYSVYSPEYYKRRMEMEGLSDTDNITVTEIKNGIILQNDTPLDNNSTSYRLDDIIVNRGVLGYPQGKDFYSETIAEISNSDDFKQAIKRGLKKREIECD